MIETMLTHEQPDNEEFEELSKLILADLVGFPHLGEIARSDAI